MSWTPFSEPKISEPSQRDGPPPAEIALATELAQSQKQITCRVLGEGDEREVQDDSKKGPDARRAGSTAFTVRVPSRHPGSCDGRQTRERRTQLIIILSLRGSSARFAATTTRAR